MDKGEKKAYITPHLTTYGTIEELTEEYHHHHHPHPHYHPHPHDDDAKWLS